MRNDGEDENMRKGKMYSMFESNVCEGFLTDIRYKHPLTNATIYIKSLFKFYSGLLTRRLSPSCRCELLILPGSVLRLPLLDPTSLYSDFQLLRFFLN